MKVQYFPEMFFNNKYMFLFPHLFFTKSFYIIILLIGSFESLLFRSSSFGHLGAWCNISKNHWMPQPALHWMLYNPNEPIKMILSDCYWSDKKERGVCLSACRDAVWRIFAEHVSFFLWFLSAADFAVLTDLVPENKQAQRDYQFK